VDAIAYAFGQAELWVALWCIIAVALFIRWRARQPALTGRQIAVLGILYALACLAKEHGIVMPGLLAAAELTLVRDGRGWRARVNAVARPTFVLGCVAAAYLLVRETVIGSWAGDYPAWTFAHATAATRGWTMLGAVTEWV